MAKPTRLCGSEIIIGSFCEIERDMSSLWLTVLRFALTARFTIMRTRNQTALSKLVEY